MKKTYQILQAVDPATLAAQVQRLMQKGWMPCGGVAIAAAAFNAEATPNGVGGRLRGGCDVHYLLQAMILNESMAIMANTLSKTLRKLARRERRS